MLENAVSWRMPILLAVLAVSLAGPARAAAQRWTFCVAWAPGARDVWITDVFPASLDRQKLAADLRNLLGRQAASHVVAQCPQPGDDKPSVVSAQTGAEEFNRKAGAVLHMVSAQDFPPRR